MAKERTFIAVKPDGVQRGLVGEIIKRFEAKGFKLAGMKFMQATEEHLQKHYEDLADKPFFAGLVKYMASGPVAAMCWEGTGVVKTARQMMGETRPADSKPGTIRGDFCIEVGRNIIHGSDSVESAEKEIKLWFKPEELITWTQANHDWIYDFLDHLGDLHTDHGKRSLNNYLKDKSYIQGYTPSSSDILLYMNINHSINKNNFPHVFRWHKHIAAICTELENNYNISGTKPEKSTKETAEEKNQSIKQQNEKPPSLPELENGISVSEKEKNSTEEKDEDENLVTEISNTYAVLLEVKPKDEETDMKELEELIRGVTLDGLKWGASQLSPLAYGIQKLSIICTVEDDRASIQDVLQKLIKFEDYVRNVDIAAFNKL